MPDPALDQADQGGLAYAAAPSDVVILHTLELRYPAFKDDDGNPTAIRVVRDHACRPDGKIGSVAVQWRRRHGHLHHSGLSTGTTKSARLYSFANKAMGINLRWGGDWDRDTEVRDNDFDDLVHFKIVEG